MYSKPEDQIMDIVHQAHGGLQRMITKSNEVIKFHAQTPAKVRHTNMKRTMQLEMDNKSQRKIIAK